MLTSKRAAGIAIAAAIVAVAATSMYILRTRSSSGRTPAATAAAPAAPAAPGRRIKVRLLYVSEDGMGLVGVEREVPFGEGLDQAREIIAAQLAPVTEPLISAVPPGTTLRSVFLTERGQLYVDLSHEVVTAHTGGALNELLTVYTFVDALTINLPAVQSVQILVDGKEVQTLAGHVDLRQPLEKNLSLVQ